MVDQAWYWLSNNSKTIVDISQFLGILIALLFTFHQQKRTDQSNRALISLDITSSHREILKMIFEHPQLTRILEEQPDLKNKPITPQERYFVVFVTNHVSSVFDAKKQNMYKINDVYKSDMARFFTLPIPNCVWNDIKKSQLPEFVAFIDALLEKNQDYKKDSK